MTNTFLMGWIASLLMGLTLGTMGAGGSILTVPILVYFFKEPPLIATTYSLFVVGSTALVGGLRAYRRGEVEFQTGLLFALPSFFGVYLMKAWLLPALPDPLLHVLGATLSKSLVIMVTFALLMVMASFSMISGGRKITATPSSERSPWVRRLSVILQGYAVGSVAGFVGAGGGFLIIPALVVLLGFQMKKAVGTSLLIIAANSIVGFMGGLKNLTTPIPWALLTWIVALALVGLWLGMNFAHKLPDQKLKKAFGYFVLIMGCLILWDQLSRI